MCVHCGVTLVSTQSWAPSTAEIEGLQARISVQPTHRVDMEVCIFLCPSSARYSSFKNKQFPEIRDCGVREPIAWVNFKVNTFLHSLLSGSPNIPPPLLSVQGLPSLEAHKESRSLSISWHYTPIKFNRRSNSSLLMGFYELVIKLCKPPNVFFLPGSELRFGIYDD